MTITKSIFCGLIAALCIILLPTAPLTQAARISTRPKGISWLQRWAITEGKSFRTEPGCP
jgi:hypothetical protein